MKAHPYVSTHWVLNNINIIYANYFWRKYVTYRHAVWKQFFNRNTGTNNIKICPICLVVFVYYVNVHFVLYQSANTKINSLDVYHPYICPTIFPWFAYFFHRINWIKNSTTTPRHLIIYFIHKYNVLNDMQNISYQFIAKQISYNGLMHMKSNWPCFERIGHMDDE